MSKKGKRKAKKLTPQHTPPPPPPSSSSSSSPHPSSEQTKLQQSGAPSPHSENNNNTNASPSPIHHDSGSGSIYPTPQIGGGGGVGAINVPITSSKLNKLPRSLLNIPKIKREQEKAISEYFNHNYNQAIDLFSSILELCDNDKCKEVKSNILTGRAYVYFRQKVLLLLFLLCSFPILFYTGY